MNCSISTLMLISEFICTSICCCARTTITKCVCCFVKIDNINKNRLLPRANCWCVWPIHVHCVVTVMQWYNWHRWSVFFYFIFHFYSFRITRNIEMNEIYEHIWINMNVCVCLCVYTYTQFSFNAWQRYHFWFVLIFILLNCMCSSKWLLLFAFFGK